MPYAVQIARTGAPDELTVAECVGLQPGPGQLLLRQTAVGLNFVDIYHRNGSYPLPSFPAVLGIEGVGIVEEVGEGPPKFQVGDHVAYIDVGVGAYASHRLLAANRAIKIPDGLNDRKIASSLLRGITAYMLLSRTYPLGEGTIALIHAGAGGLGQILTNWAKRRGSEVIATVGSDAKSEAARAAGADHVLLHGAPDLVDRVLELSGGQGANVVYDGIGGSMLLKSLACVRPFGVVASIGESGGPIPPLDVTEIGPRRSASLSRPSVMAYVRDEQVYRTAASAYFAELQNGLRMAPSTEYPLREVAVAHADLERGRTRGSIVLIP